MKKQMLQFVGGLALVMAFMLTACEKTDLNTETLVENYVDQSLFEMQKEGSCGKFGCFELVFPITIEFSDATTVEVTDYETFKEAIRTWKEANPDAEERPTFVFPIEVLTQEGEIISVASQEELIALKEECPNDWGRKGRKGHGNQCFDLVFPVNINFPDGSSAEVEGRRDLKQTIRAWKADNPDAEERPELAFPIDVQMEEDDAIVTVNSKEELIALKESCSEE